LLRIGVAGALGRMGSLVCETVRSQPDLKLVEVIDPAIEQVKELPTYFSELKAYKRIEDIENPIMEILVDFTRAQAAYENIMWAVKRDIHCVVGTTGLTEENMRSIEGAVNQEKANVIIAANFAIGAVLMMKFSEIAARFYDRCEIVELHHAKKIDAPSGTALATARRVDSKIKARGGDSVLEKDDAPSRGVKHGNVFIHSVRLDGLVAHQEVIFGSKGETLKIRHDTTDRSCFMPGVIMAVRAVSNMRGLTIGMESILGI